MNMRRTQFHNNLVYGLILCGEMRVVVAVLRWYLMRILRSVINFGVTTLILNLKLYHGNDFLLAH